MFGQGQSWRLVEPGSKVKGWSKHRAWVLCWHQEFSSARRTGQCGDRHQGGCGVPVPEDFKLDKAMSHLTKS